MRNNLGENNEDELRFLNSLEPNKGRSADFSNFQFVQIKHKKPTWWGRFKWKVKSNPGAFVLFCMQMFWPVVLLVWILLRKFGG